GESAPRAPANMWGGEQLDPERAKRLRVAVHALQERMKPCGKIHDEIELWRCACKAFCARPMAALRDDDAMTLTWPLAEVGGLRIEFGPHGTLLSCRYHDLGGRIAVDLACKK